VNVRDLATPLPPQQDAFGGRLHNADSASYPRETLSRDDDWGPTQWWPRPEPACPRTCSEGRRAAAGSKRASTSSARGCRAG